MNNTVKLTEQEQNNLWNLIGGPQDNFSPIYLFQVEKQGGVSYREEHKEGYGPVLKIDMNDECYNYWKQQGM